MLSAPVGHWGQQRLELDTPRVVALGVEVYRRGAQRPSANGEHAAQHLRVVSGAAGAKGQ